MVTLEKLRELGLSFAESSEEPHFEKTSFRVKGKIFATYNSVEHQLVVKLTPVQQSVFGAFDKTVCYPVPNKWGLQGWTIVKLAEVDAEFVQDILKTSYCNVAPKKLTEIYNNQ
ncbi:MAG: MmcQ/YjbR family DNA-binding protein [Bacteroidota bacterium]